MSTPAVPANTRPGPAAAARLELRLDRAAQLFDVPPASPFRDGALAQEAEDYILAKARRLAAGAPIELVVHLPSEEAAGPDAGRIAPAVAAHFGRLAEEQTKDLRDLRQDGRRALAIGLVLFVTCLTAAFVLAGALTDRPITRVLEQSLVILGWVALWKPIEVMLHDWLPVGRRRKLLRRIAAARVTLEQSERARSAA